MNATKDHISNMIKKKIFGFKSFKSCGGILCFWSCCGHQEWFPKSRFCTKYLHAFKQTLELEFMFGLTLYIPTFMFSGQLHFQANTVFMSSELQLIFPSNRRDLQQLTARESSLALPVTSRAISPLSSINLTVDIASINLAPSRLTLADLIQTAVHYLPQMPWALPLRNGKGRRIREGGTHAYLENAFCRRGRKWPQGVWGCQLLVSDTFWDVLFLTLIQIDMAWTAVAIAFFRVRKGYFYSSILHDIYFLFLAL